MPKQAPGLISLFGSGELSDTMAETHRILMARLQEPINPVFIDTPAGFELNIDSIDHKAISYFERNFGLSLTVARYRTPLTAWTLSPQRLKPSERATTFFQGRASLTTPVGDCGAAKFGRAVLTGGPGA